MDASTEALVALGAVGTGVAYILNLRIIQAAGPTVAASVTYGVPLWSTLFGAVPLGEPVGPATLAGAVLVIGGAMLTAARRDTPPSSSAPDVTTAAGRARTACR